MPDQPSNGGGLDTLVVDPQFAALKPGDQRKALSGVSGDTSFDSLSDDDTTRYVNAHRATLPSPGQNLKAGDLSESEAAVNRPIAPQPITPKPIEQIAPVRAARGFNRSMGVPDNLADLGKAAMPSLRRLLDPTGGALSSIVDAARASRDASQA